MANIITAGNSTNGGTSLSSDTSGILQIKTGSGAGTAAITADASQNVGIGTASPSTKLEIATTNQSMKFTGSGAANWTTITNSSGSYNFGVDANGFNIYDNTASAYRMIINSNGIMTTPSLPSFLASFATATTLSIAPNTKITFNSVKFDNGSNFSTGNNRYTAPVTGTYKFTASFHCNVTTQNRPVYRVNGSDYYITSDAAQSILQTGAGGDICLICDIVMQLSAGDYVELFNRAGGASNMSIFTGHSWWSGFLIG